ncbi:hypothetical protein [Planctomicrobium sp. SH664]|uniref:hypothetical protein n=1 Tax=Planctomicrobium sp. SH664 TaxID=3448125 RepID=UPI003F5C8B6D
MAAHVPSTGAPRPMPAAQWTSWPVTQVNWEAPEGTTGDAAAPREFPGRAIPLGEFWSSTSFERVAAPATFELGDDLWRTTSPQVRNLSAGDRRTAQAGEPTPAPPASGKVLLPSPAPDYSGDSLIPPAVPPAFETPRGGPPKPPDFAVDGPSSLIPGADDAIFRPIAKIQPYYDYSPTSESPGAYLCPQPSSIPDDLRARCPEILALPSHGSTARHFPETAFQWEASNLYHKPLYFEDVPLERYGHAFPDGVQPFVSVGKFGVQLAALPYQIALDPVWRDQYVLGYYRPGDPAPYLCYRAPLNLKAAAAAAGVYTGLIFLVQ